MIDDVGHGARAHANNDREEPDRNTEQGECLRRDRRAACPIGTGATQRHGGSSGTAKSESRAPEGRSFAFGMTAERRVPPRYCEYFAYAAASLVSYENLA